MADHSRSIGDLLDERGVRSTPQRESCTQLQLGAGPFCSGVQTATSCPECGAAVAQGREACQTLFDEMLAREFGDYRYARMHRLTVDAYALQHPAEYMRSSKSYAAHLTGMYAALETDTPAEINRAVQQWLNGAKEFSRPDHPAPQQRGALTILHVHAAIEPDDHLRRVREWALSAWEAWRAYHQLARQWVEQATANRRAV